MKVRYRNLEHRDNEATMMAFIIRPRITPRGKRISSIYEAHLRIDLTVPTDGTVTTTAECQSWLNTEIGKVIDAYGENGGDLIFYHDDGTPTRHSLLSAQSVSGVTVRHRTWPKGDGAEYATVRTGYVVLQAEYIELDSPIWEYRETVRTVSTSGRRWRFQEREFGLPIAYQLNQRTIQHITQSGHAIGTLGYPLDWIAPIYDLNSEHEDLRVVEPSSPRQMGNGFMMYPIQWTFQFSLIVPQNTLPRIL